MSLKTPIRVLISGAAGQIGYSLIPLVASGQTFGLDQPVHLHLLDIAPAKKVLEGVVMEVNDGAYPLVASVAAFTEYPGAFADIDVAVLVGGFPRGPGMLRKDLLSKNNAIFVSAGEALNQYARPDVKVVVVANPANTNCLVASTHASKIPKKNFSALTRLDMNRAQNLLAQRIGFPADCIRNVVIFGNHSKTQVPDAFNAIVHQDGKTQSLPQLLGDDAWLESEFMTIVQQRGAAVIAARGLSSAMSAANAIKDHLRSLFLGTPEGEHVSMAVYSDGSYGVSEGIFFSFPVTCKNGEWTIVQNLSLNDSVKAKIKLTEQELLEEKAEAGI